MSEEKEGHGKKERRDSDLAVRSELTPRSPEAFPSPGQLSATTLFGAPDLVPSNVRPGKVTRTGLISRKATGEVPDERAEEALGEVQGSTGAPLPPTLRAMLEAALGQSLDAVRVHVGEAPHRASRALAARAFTTGSDIYFAEGAYEPGTNAGRELIAHEVAHTVQSPTAATSGRVSNPGDAHERDADSFASAFVTGRAPVARPTPGAAPPGIHRYSDAQLARAAADREIVIDNIAAAVRSGQARQNLRAIRQAIREAIRQNRRNDGESLVFVRIASNVRQLRYEDLQLLLGRVDHAIAEVRRGGDERPDDPPGQDPDTRALTLSEEDRENMARAPESAMLEGELTPDDVEQIVTRTRAFGPAIQGQISRALRRNGIEPGSLSEHIHYLPTSEFRPRAIAYLEAMFNASERRQLRDIIRQQAETLYGFTEEETHQSYIDREHAENSHRIHEAVHLLQAARFIRATEDPANHQRAPNHTAFHEAATSYITMVIAAGNNIEYHDDYPRELVEQVGRIAARVGNAAFFEAYMTGDLSAIVSEIPLFDQFLEGFYRADIERIDAAIAGRQSANVHSSDTLGGRSRRRPGGRRR